MINNETIQSILARRSYKVFDSRPIDDEALETIVTAGLYAPTGIPTRSANWPMPGAVISPTGIAATIMP